mgnify:CR=1 FL=1
MLITQLNFLNSFDKNFSEMNRNERRKYIRGLIKYKLWDADVIAYFDIKNKSRLCN